MDAHPAKSHVPSVFPPIGVTTFRCSLIQQPCCRIMAVCNPEHRRLLLKINFQRISIAAGKGIALRRMEKRRRHSRDRRQAFFSPRKRRYGTQQSPRIRMTGIIKNLIHGPDLYDFPAYMTATRSAIRATTPRSCVTKTVAVPSFFWISRSRSRICA